MTEIQIKQGWKEVKLGEVITIKHGYAFKGEFFTEEVTNKILLTPGNFAIGGGFQLNKPKYYNGKIPNDYILKINDLVVTMTDLSKTGDTLGFPALIPSHKECIFLHNQRIGLVSCNDSINKKYLFQFLKTREYQKQVVGSAAGATVRHTSPKKIYEIQPTLPPLPIQNKIAEILGNYDDLIEANNRRIKILETQAAKIYTEWFVHYRYPGCENVPLVDSGTDFGMIPQGWEVRRIGDIVLIKKGKNITKDTITEGAVPVVAGGLTPAYYHNKANTSKPVITISASGANAGFVNFYFQDIWASDCSYIDNNSTKFIYFFYLFMKENQTIISSLQKGSAQPHVYPKDLMEISFLDPLIEITHKFENHATSLFLEIENLQQQNQNLKKSRDLLIPQLVGGLLEV